MVEQKWMDQRTQPCQLMSDCDEVSVLAPKVDKLKAHVVFFSSYFFLAAHKKWINGSCFARQITV